MSNDFWEKHKKKMKMIMTYKYILLMHIIIEENLLGYAANHVAAGWRRLCVRPGKEYHAVVFPS